MFMAMVMMSMKMSMDMKMMMKVRNISLSPMNVMIFVRPLLRPSGIVTNGMIFKG